MVWFVLSPLGERVRGLNEGGMFIAICMLVGRMCVCLPRLNAHPGRSRTFYSNGVQSYHDISTTMWSVSPALLCVALH